MNPPSSAPAVHWSFLHDAYGPAVTIPKHLTALASRRRSTRVEALEQLGTRLCHQRLTLVEASSYAVRPLTELACRPDVADRSSILELLQAMAERAWAGESEPQRPFQLACREALTHEGERIRALLADPEPEVRARAALVSGFVCQSTRASSQALLEQLQTALAHEPEADVRTAYVAALAQHAAYALLLPRLEDVALGPRLAAAFALLSIDPLDPRALELVRQALAAPAQTTREYGSASRYYPLDLTTRVCRASDAVRTSLLPALLALTSACSPYDADERILPLLETLFPSGWSPPLSAQQAALVATLAQNSRLFESAPDARVLLSEHRLPVRPGRLRALAAAGPASHAELVPVRAAAPASVPEQLASLLRGRSPGEVTHLQLSVSVSEPLLAELARLPNLEQLVIKSARISATALAVLAPLRALELEDVELDEGGACSLAALPRLASLTLTDVQLGEGALAVLADSGSLRELRLIGVPVTLRALGALSESSLETLLFSECEGSSVDVLAQLEALPELRRLKFVATELDAGALATLRRCAKLELLMLSRVTLREAVALPSTLRTLQLHGSRLSSAFLSALAPLPHLRGLELTGVELASDHFLMLSRLSQLQEIRLTEPADRQQLTRLRRELPHVRLHVAPREKRPDAGGA